MLTTQELKQNIKTIATILVNQNTHVIAFTPIAQNKKPGGNLLSHANAHYHRRSSVSQFCSGWEDVGPKCYGRQAKLFCVFIIRKHA